MSIDYSCLNDEDIPFMKQFVENMTNGTVGQIKFVIIIGELDGSLLKFDAQIMNELKKAGSRYCSISVYSTKEQLEENTAFRFIGDECKDQEYMKTLPSVIGTNNNFIMTSTKNVKMPNEIKSVMKIIRLKES